MGAGDAQGHKGLGREGLQTSAAALAEKQGAREPETNRKNFELLFGWWKEGKLKPAISHRFPLAKAAEALGALARREVVGKVVLEVGDRERSA